LYGQIFKTIWTPQERISAISKECRKIAKDLESGKTINPEKIKKLAGSLAYWNEKFFQAGLNILLDPLGVLKAHCEMAKATAPPKEEPAEKVPADPLEQGRSVLKYLKTLPGHLNWFFSPDVREQLKELRPEVMEALISVETVIADFKRDLGAEVEARE